MDNFIGLRREIFHHWIYQDAEYFKVWLTMICRARFAEEPEKKMHRKIVYEIKRGEFIYGREGWSRDCKISESRLRTLVKKLLDEKMIEIVENISNQFTIYKIVNYEKYNQRYDQRLALEPQQLQEDSNQRYNQGIARESPGNRQGIATQEEGKKETKKECKKKNTYGEFGNVSMPEEDYQSLVEKYGLNTTNEVIDAVDLWFGNNPKVRDLRDKHILTVVAFMRKRGIEPLKKKQQQPDQIKIGERRLLTAEEQVLAREQVSKALGEKGLDIFKKR